MSGPPFTCRTQARPTASGTGRCPTECPVEGSRVLRLSSPASSGHTSGKAVPGALVPGCQLQPWLGVRTPIEWASVQTETADCVLFQPHLLRAPFFLPPGSQLDLIPKLFGFPRGPFRTHPAQHPGLDLLPGVRCPPLSQVLRSLKRRSLAPTPISTNVQGVSSWSGCLCPYMCVL